MKGPVVQRRLFIHQFRSVKNVHEWSPKPIAISTAAAYFSGVGWAAIEVYPRAWSIHQKNARSIALKNAPSGPTPNILSVFRISIKVSRKGAKAQTDLVISIGCLCVLWGLCEKFHFLRNHYSLLAYASSRKRVRPFKIRQERRRCSTLTCTFLGKLDKKMFKAKLLCVGIYPVKLLLRDGSIQIRILLMNNGMILGHQA